MQVKCWAKKLKSNGESNGDMRMGMRMGMRARCYEMKYCKRFSVH